MEHQPFVYGLFDPADVGHIRYVGMAPSNSSRPYAHAKRARKDVTDDSYLMHWIRKIQAEGREPSVMILEQLSEGTGRKFCGFVESCYIKSLRQIGHRLTNENDGGWGGSNGKHTPESIAAMKAGWTSEVRARVGAASHKRETGKTHSAETCAKHRASFTTERRIQVGAQAKERNTGLKRSEETKAQQSASAKTSWEKGERHGTKHTQEAKDAISKALTGRVMSEEWRAKNAAAQLGKKQSDETKAKRSAALKAAWARRKAQKET